MSAVPLNKGITDGSLRPPSVQIPIRSSSQAGLGSVAWQLARTTTKLDGSSTALRAVLKSQELTKLCWTKNHIPGKVFLNKEKSKYLKSN